ncbi:MAG: hypothetical protein ACPGXK_13850, partial [Phycisphaerae bacterium]
VRARDENAGGVVRCSYCGKESTVPENREDDLDFLFEDLEQGEAESGKRKPKKRTRKVFKGGGNKPYDPFAVIVKLTYAAILIVVVVVVGRKVILPAAQNLLAQNNSERRTNASTTDTKNESEESGGRRRRGSSSTSRRSANGLIEKGKKGLRGIYVASTPPNADGYYIAADKAPKTGRIHRLPGATSFRVGDQEPCSRAQDGMYVVEIAVPWNDKGLVGYRDYTTFRRSIDQASAGERTKLVREYFLPDESEASATVFIDESDVQKYIVRQYRNVEVFNGKADRGVRALFLPRLMKADDTLNMEELVLKYLPTKDRYAFDESHVIGELNYYDVRASDQTYVMQALKRIGTIPYITEDGRTRLFMINIHDGEFSQKVIRGR